MCVPPKDTYVYEGTSGYLEDERILLSMSKMHPYQNRWQHLWGLCRVSLLLVCLCLALLHCNCIICTTITIVTIHTNTTRQTTPTHPIPFCRKRWFAIMNRNELCNPRSHVKETDRRGVVSRQRVKEILSFLALSFIYLSYSYKNKYS